jgi:hypothetical protein
MGTVAMATGCQPPSVVTPTPTDATTPAASPDAATDEYLRAYCTFTGDWPVMQRALFTMFDPRSMDSERAAARESAGSARSRLAIALESLHPPVGGASRATIHFKGALAEIASLLDAWSAARDPDDVLETLNDALHRFGVELEAARAELEGMGIPCGPNALPS